MRTFEEYQSVATRTPLSLRNNRDRINLPVLGLQEEAAKVGSLLASADASGKLALPIYTKASRPERRSLCGIIGTGSISPSWGCRKKQPRSDRCWRQQMHQAN